MSNIDDIFKVKFDAKDNGKFNLQLNSNIKSNSNIARKQLSLGSKFVLDILSEEAEYSEIYHNKYSNAQSDFTNMFSDPS